VPRRIAQAIDRCLAKDRADRADGPAALAEQLGHALEQRRELPIALRAFVKHDSRLDGPGVLLYPFAMLIATPVVGMLTGSVLLGFATLVGGYTLVPLGVLARSASKLLKAGFGHADLSVAFKAEIDRSREERAFGGGHKASVLERALKWISGTSLSVSMLCLGGIISIGPPLESLGSVFAGSMFIGVGTGVGMLIMLQRRRDVDAEFWGRLWTGRLGKWLFGIARAFTPQRALPASLTHRPTELALGMAAEQLYESLPKETRRQLRDLPDVVHRLETDAQRMRRRFEELQEALVDATPNGDARHDRIVADLSAERDLVQQRLKDAVTALETIRLNLLRLHAGTGSVRSLTTDLGLARELARDIGAQVDGLREVEDAL
jgi:serine/threonine-protein kinase